MKLLAASIHIISIHNMNLKYTKLILHADIPRNSIEWLKKYYSSIYCGTAVPWIPRLFGLPFLYSPFKTWILKYNCLLNVDLYIIIIKDWFDFFLQLNYKTFNFTWTYQALWLLQNIMANANWWPQRWNWFRNKNGSSGHTQQFKWS